MDFLRHVLDVFSFQTADSSKEDNSYLFLRTCSKS